MNSYPMKMPLTYKITSVSNGLWNDGVDNSSGLPTIVGVNRQTKEFGMGKETLHGRSLMVVAGTAGPDGGKGGWWWRVLNSD